MDPRSRSNDRKREVKFEDEVVGSHGLDKRHRTLSQPVLTSHYVDVGGLRYADVVADYGVPPGYDFEQYSDITHARQVRKKGILQAHGELNLTRNGAVLHQDRLMVVPQRTLPNKVPPPPPAYNSQSELRESPVVAPPRTKHRLNQANASPANVRKPPRPKSERTPKIEPGATSSRVPPPVPELDLDQEISEYSSIMEDIDFDSTGSKKKSKLPWKKSKGRFTPTKEMDKISSKMGSLSRSSSRTSLASSFTSEAPSEISMQRKVPSKEHVGKNMDLAQPTQPAATKHATKPPPAPKPKHLAQQSASQRQPEQVSEQQHKVVSPPPQAQKPPPPPKPHQETTKSHKHADSSQKQPSPSNKPPISQKPQQQHKDDHVVMREKQRPDNVQNSRRHISSPYADIGDVKDGRISRNCFSGYEDVEADDSDIIMSENPYESVMIRRSMHREERMSGLSHTEDETSEERMSGLSHTEEETSEEEEEEEEKEEEEDEIHEAAIDVPTGQHNLHCHLCDK